MGAVVAGSVAASAGGASAGGAGGGNPLKLVEQVQFMAVSGSMSVPMPDEYRAFTSGKEFL